MQKRKVAVVIYNLGGPCCLESVRGFLFNLFNDPAIIKLPYILRFLLAKLISWRREHKATEIYKKMGGGSPILRQTYDQANALEKALNSGLEKEYEFSVHVCMRYSYPRASDVLDSLLLGSYEKVVLLSLYPQYSTTTTSSSIQDFKKALEESGMAVDFASIESYPDHPLFLASYAKLLKASLDQALKIAQDPIVLFSAHGIPMNRIEAGDPYQKHVERSAYGVMEHLGMKDVEWIICYQSKVGPLKWLEPATDAMIEHYARQNRAIVVVPIAFVSEHSETLVELDMDYKELAEQSGCKAYLRVPAVYIDDSYIECLKELVYENVGITN